MDKSYLIPIRFSKYKFDGMKQKKITFLYIKSACRPWLPFYWYYNQFRFETYLTCSSFVWIIYDASLFTFFFTQTHDGKTDSCVTHTYMIYFWTASTVARISDRLHYSILLASYCNASFYLWLQIFFFFIIEEFSCFFIHFFFFFGSRLSFFFIYIY